MPGLHRSWGFRGAALSPGCALVFTAACPQIRAREMSFYMDFSFALMAFPEGPSGCKSPLRSLSHRTAPKAATATAVSAVWSNICWRRATAPLSALGAFVQRLV